MCTVKICDLNGSVHQFVNICLTGWGQKIGHKCPDVSFFYRFGLSPDLAHCTVLSIPCYIRLDNNRIFLHYSRLDTRECFLITAILYCQVKRWLFLYFFVYLSWSTLHAVHWMYNCSWAIIFLYVWWQFCTHDLSTYHIWCV